MRQACREGDIDKVLELISRGVSLSCRDEAFERTPLHYAAHHGHADIVNVLLRHRADPLAIDVRLASQTRRADPKAL
jgi:ankyrin repeat protein